MLLNTDKTKFKTNSVERAFYQGHQVYRILYGVYNIPTYDVNSLPTPLISSMVWDSDARTISIVWHLDSLSTMQVAFCQSSTLTVTLAQCSTALTDVSIKRTWTVVAENLTISDPSSTGYFDISVRTVFSIGSASFVGELWKLKVDCPEFKPGEYGTMYTYTIDTTTESGGGSGSGSSTGSFVAWSELEEDERWYYEEDYNVMFFVRMPPTDPRFEVDWTPYRSWLEDRFADIFSNHGYSYIVPHFYPIYDDNWDLVLKYYGYHLEPTDDLLNNWQYNTDLWGDNGTDVDESSILARLFDTICENHLDAEYPALNEIGNGEPKPTILVVAGFPTVGYDGHSWKTTKEIEYTNDIAYEYVIPSSATIIGDEDVYLVESNYLPTRNNDPNGDFASIEFPSLYMTYSIEDSTVSTMTSQEYADWNALMAAEGCYSSSATEYMNGLRATANKTVQQMLPYNQSYNPEGYQYTDSADDLRTDNWHRWYLDYAYYTGDGLGSSVGLILNDGDQSKVPLGWLMMKGLGIVVYNQMLVHTNAGYEQRYDIDWTQEITNMLRNQIMIPEDVLEVPNSEFIAMISDIANFTVSCYEESSGCNEDATLQEVKSHVEQLVREERFTWTVTDD